MVYLHILQIIMLKYIEEENKMNEEEYLRARIQELENNIKGVFISTKVRKNQEVALRFYKNTLDRVVAFNNFREH